MNTRVEIFPLATHLVVAHQLGICLGMFETGLDVVGYEVGEEQGVDPLVLIFWLDGDEQQVDYVRVASEGAQQVPPPGGEEAAPALLQGAGE